MQIYRIILEQHESDTFTTFTIWHNLPFSANDTKNSKFFNFPFFDVNDVLRC